MRYISHQNQHLLRSQTFLPAPSQLQTGFISLYLGFAGTAVIIHMDAFLSRPRVYRADQQGLLALTTLCPPAQRQPLDRTNQRDRSWGNSDPAIIWSHFVPGALRELADHGCWPPSPSTFAHHLPACSQGGVHVAVAAKATIRAQDRASLLLLPKSEKSLERVEDRNVGRGTGLVAWVEP